MQELISPVIAAIALIAENVLLINYDCDWAQENIDQLSEHFIGQLNGARRIETITGADRETLRFSWQGQCFFIHFECYSQSCWVESDSNEAHVLLLQMQAQLAGLAKR